MPVYAKTPMIASHSDGVNGDSATKKVSEKERLRWSPSLRHTIM